MGGRKRSNLRAWQDAKEERRVRLINEALVVLLHEKAWYPDVTALAKRVAAMVSLQEMSDPALKSPGISYTTLLRRARNGSSGPYRLQLEMFQSGSFGSGDVTRILSTKDLEGYIMKYPALRAYIATKELEISNLRTALEENDQQMKRLKRHLQLQHRGSTQVSAQVCQPKLDDLNQAKQDITLTFTWIERLLKREDMAWLEIDELNEVILDGSKLRKPPIAEKSLLAPFFKALKIRRQGLGQNDECS